MTTSSGLRSATVPGATVCGTGRALPSRLVSDADVAAMLGHDMTASGIDGYGGGQRYWCSAEESTADLAEEAARHALAAAGVEARDVGLLVVATSTPEFVMPPTSAVVHGRLELGDAPAVDLSAGGSDFLSALDLACKSIAYDPELSHVLVVGVSAMSKYLDTHDARTVPVYADGAGAVVLSAGEHHGLLASATRTLGLHSHDVGVFAGGTRTPITSAVLEAGLQNRLRVLREFPELLPSRWGELVCQTLGQAGVTEGDVSRWLWSHPSPEAVIRTIEHVGGHVPPDDVAFAAIARHGYTGAAALPMALDVLAREGGIAEGDCIVLAAAGAGVSFGVTVLRWAVPVPA